MPKITPIHTFVDNSRAYAADMNSAIQQIIDLLNGQLDFDNFANSGIHLENLDFQVIMQTPVPTVADLPTTDPLMTIRLVLADNVFYLYNAGQWDAIIRVINHNDLANRNVPDAHSISAITGLETRLTTDETSINSNTTNITNLTSTQNNLLTRMTNVESNKADNSNVYQKTDTYSKTETNNLLANYYTKADDDTKNTEQDGRLSTAEGKIQDHENRITFIEINGTGSGSGGGAIDDTVTVDNETWSSNKINNELISRDNTITSLTSTVNGKADASALNSYYTKTQMDTSLGLKADNSNVYTKSDIDTSLGLKADKSTTYTKSDIDTQMTNKADASSLNSLDLRVGTNETNISALQSVRNPLAFRDLFKDNTYTKGQFYVTAVSGGNSISSTYDGDDTTYHKFNANANNPYYYMNYSFSGITKTFYVDHVRIKQDATVNYSVTINIKSSNTTIWTKTLPAASEMDVVVDSLLLATEIDIVFGALNGQQVIVDTVEVWGTEELPTKYYLDSSFYKPGTNLTVDTTIRKTVPTLYLDATRSNKAYIQWNANLSATYGLDIFEEGVKRMNLSANGVTAFDKTKNGLYLVKTAADNYGFRMFVSSGNMNVVNGVDTALIFNGRDWEMGTTTAYDTTTGIYTVPKSGIYQFNVHLRGLNMPNGSVVKITVNKNGVYEKEIDNKYFATGTNTSFGGSFQLRLTANDTIKLIYNVTATGWDGSLATGRTDSYFDCALVIPE